MGAESSAPSAELSEARLASEVDAEPAHDAGVPHGALSVPQPITIAIGKSAASARTLRSMSESMVMTAEHIVYQSAECGCSAIAGDTRHGSCFPDGRCVSAALATVSQWHNASGTRGESDVTDPEDE